MLPDLLPYGSVCSAIDRGRNKLNEQHFLTIKPNNALPVSLGSLDLQCAGLYMMSFYRPRQIKTKKTTDEAHSRSGSFANVGNFRA